MNAALGPTCSTEESFEQLVLEYQMPLKRMCYMYLHDMALAEDAVQETFLKVYRSLPQFGGGCSVKTWIMKIGVNTCRDMLRSAWFRHHDRRIVPEELQVPAEENPCAEETNDLGQAILKLPVKYKDVILLYYYQDMNQDEIAEILQTSASTISRRLKRAQEKLRDVLKGGREDE